jgi:hypothetical protein
LEAPPIARMAVRATRGTGVRSPDWRPECNSTRLKPRRKSPPGRASPGSRPSPRPKRRRKDRTSTFPLRRRRARARRRDRSRRSANPRTSLLRSNGEVLVGGYIVQVNGLLNKWRAMWNPHSLV